MKKSDTFLLFTRQQIKSMVGIYSVRMPTSQLENQSISCVLDGYVTMKIISQLIPKIDNRELEEKINLKQALSQSSNDCMKEIKSGLYEIESLYPLQTAEVDAIIDSIKDINAFVERFFGIRKDENQNKSHINWTQDESNKIKIMRMNIDYFISIIESLDGLPVDPNSEIIKMAKESTRKDLKKILKNEAKESVKDDFVAWASLQSKRDYEREKEESTETEEKS